MKELLSQMIPVSSSAIDIIIKKIDNKNSNQISWEEYYHFLKNEGERREEVNSAQLYGVSTKRLLTTP